MKHSLSLAFAAAALATSAVAQPTVDFLVTNRFVEPYGIAVDGGNKFYISDSADHRVYKYDPDNGVLTALAGASGQRGTNNGPGFVARFFSPKGIVAARDGLIVADSGNHSLRFLSLTGSVSVVSNFAGSPGIAGFADGPVAAARFNNPLGLATDAAGNIYVADSKNNAIRKIDSANIVSTIATNFSEPSAIAVGDQGQLYVADTRNHSIKLISPNGTVSLLAGKGMPTASGTNDSYFAEEALFNSPSGLIWLGGATGLLVSDTGNHTLRRIFYDPDVAFFFPDKNGYSVETYAGAPGQRGFNDGLLNAARFNNPVSLARDFDNGLLIADLGNSALRRIQTTPRQPRVTNPKIGYVTFVMDQSTGTEISKLVPFTEAVFNNDVILAILAEERTETFFTSGTTPGLFEPDTIPVPNSDNSQPSPPYSDGQSRSQVKPSFLDPRPDITVKAISSADGRRPSEIVQARIQFKVSTPTILGDNPASFVLTNETAGADMWYTLDGSAPTNQAPSIQAAGDQISLRIIDPVTFKARGFKRNYKPSEITTKTFYPSDFQANRISFGFERGEASGQFLASAGQTYIAPVTLSVLPSQLMYSLQFNVTVTNLNNAVPVTPGAVGFESMLLQPLPDGTYKTIDPKMFERYDIEVFTNIVPNGTLVTTNYQPIFRDLLVTNASLNLLGVGWLEILGATNYLYDTRNQDLISYSRAHNRIYLKSDNKAVLGAYSFQVPLAALSDSLYRIQLGRPSAVENALSKDVFIDTPTNGSIGAGAINAFKEVKIVPGGLGAGQLHYIVGDLDPFRWYNAGDFGDTNILNNDVYEIFQAASYQLNLPPAGSDFFDALDSCCGGIDSASLSDLYDGSQTDINLITMGDGQLDVTDVFVTFRRSLDPSLKWFARYWVNGQRQAAEVPNVFRGQLNAVGNAPATTARFSKKSLKSGSNPLPSVLFQADDLPIKPGELVNVPIRAEISGDYPIRILMINLTVEALNGAPEVSEAVQFIANPLLGNPAFTQSASSANFSAAWLDHTISGLSGSSLIGTLRVRIPATASADASYRVIFQHASASPNGFSKLARQVTNGLLTSADHSKSSFNDGIPDSWRLRYFGSLINQLSQADADADGDGLSNIAEFKAGTDPNDVQSALRLQAVKNAQEGLGGSLLTLHWPSIRGKAYSIQVSSSVTQPSNNWISIASDLQGTGGDMQFTINNPVTSNQFYRVIVAE